MNASSYITNLGPEIILTLTACVVLMVGVFRSRTSGSVAAPLAIIGTLVALFVAWQNRAAIIQHDIPGIRVTDLTLYVRYITLAVGALILLVNWHLPVKQERDEFFSLILFSMTGVMLTAASNDLVVLFFALELVSVPTYALVAISREDVKAQESGVKYFFLGAMAAAMMAYGFSFLYGLAGTTVLFGADRSVAAFLSAPGSLPTLATVGLLLAVGGIAFKIAAVPLHVYAPDVYQGAASPVTGMLGFLPKLAGFVALIILFSLTGWELSWPLKWAVWIIAVATMTVGNVLALLQSNAKRMLAYSSIAHSGYMLIGILVGPVAGEGPFHDGLAAVMFYIAIYGVMNLGAFAVLAYVQVAGKEAEELDDLAGLSRHFPAASLALAICCFSLMGFPPTAGFLGKVYIFSSAFSVDAAGGFRTEMIWLAVIGVVNSAIAAAYYLRIIGVCYLRERHEAAESTGGRPLKLAMALCSLSLILLFAWPRTLLHTAQNATQDAAPAPAAQLALDHP